MDEMMMKGLGFLGFLERKNLQWFAIKLIVTADVSFLIKKTRANFLLSTLFNSKFLGQH